MEQDKYTLYLRKIGRKIGLQLQFDEELICEVAVNEDDGVAIAAHPEDHTLVFTSVVAADLPDPISYSLMMDLLDLGIGPVLTGGGNSPLVGRDPDTGVLVLYQVCTEPFLDKGDAGEIFLAFYKFKRRLQAHIAADQNTHDEHLNFTGMVTG